MFKKKIIILMVLALILSISTGCSSHKEPERTRQIPSDGIIEKSAFLSIKENRDIGIFNGISNDITYQWLFMGDTLTDTKDEDLRIAFSNAKTEAVRNLLSANHIQEFSFITSDMIAGNPTLSVYFAVPWDADGAEIYKYNTAANSVTLIATAAFENSPNAIVTFTPQEYKGLFYIVGTKDAKANKADASSDTAFLENPKLQSSSDGHVTDESNSDGTTQSFGSGNSNHHDNQNIEQDKYLTDPIPEGKPTPVEPGDIAIDTSKELTCTLSIRCDTILNNMNKFNKDKLSVLPADGVIMKTYTVDFSDGESVFDILKREMRNRTETFLRRQQFLYHCCQPHITAQNVWNDHK